MKLTSQKASLKGHFWCFFLTIDSFAKKSGRDQKKDQRVARVQKGILTMAEKVTHTIGIEVQLCWSVSGKVDPKAKKNRRERMTFSITMSVKTLPLYNLLLQNIFVIKRAMSHCTIHRDLNSNSHKLFWTGLWFIEGWFYIMGVPKKAVWTFAATGSFPYFPVIFHNMNTLF